MPLQLATDLAPGTTLKLKADVSWLECETKCIPGSAELRAALEIGSESRPSADKPLIDAWQRKLPKKADSLQARAQWEGPESAPTRSLLIEWNTATQPEDEDFYPDAS